MSVLGKGQRMIKNEGTQKQEKVKAIKLLKNVTKYYKSNLLTKKDC